MFINVETFQLLIKLDKKIVGRLITEQPDPRPEKNTGIIILLIVL